MDLRKAAEMFQILGFFPACYCAYAAFNSSQPTQSGSSTGWIVTPTSSSILIAFGGFAALSVAGIVLSFLSSRQPDPTKLVIHYAHFGIGTWFWKYDRVTKIVRSHVVGGNSLDLVLGRPNFGDSFWGTPKHTTIKYSFGGVTRIRVFPEDHRLVILPTDADLDHQIARKREWKKKAEELQKELTQLKLVSGMSSAPDPSLTLEYSDDVGFGLSNRSGFDAVNILIPRVVQGVLWVDWDCPTVLSHGSSQPIPISIKNSDTGDVITTDPKQIIETGWKEQIGSIPNRTGVEFAIAIYVEYGSRGGKAFKSHWEIKYNLGTKRISLRFIRDENI